MWKSLLKTGCFFFLLVLVGYGPSIQNSLAQARAHTTHSAWVRPGADFSPFAGRWTAHGSQLVVSSNGTATFVARTYNWCTSSPVKPCDSMNAQGQIRAGNQERLKLSRISGSTVYGTVVSSNFHPTGLAVTLTLQPGDILVYASHTPIAFLCGPAAAPGACGA
jgi:hypothetical protein